MLTSAMPKQGVFYSPALDYMPLTRDWNPGITQLKEEDELTIVGGVDPNSIETVEMYDSTAKKLIVVAHRNEKNHIVLINLTTAEKSIYGFSRSGKLRLLGSRNLDGDEVEVLESKLSNDKEDEVAQHFEDYDDIDNDDEELLGQSTLAKLGTSKLFSE